MRIGILSSGGDAPGINDILLGAAQQAETHGDELLGFEDGYTGLLHGRAVHLPAAAVEPNAGLAGTMLGTSRNPDVRQEEGIKRALAAARAARLDGLVVIGGNGSLIAASRLAGAGLAVSFVPATIDNDVPGSAVTIGFDSAVAYAADAVQRLRVTGKALRGRAFLLQTLGGGTSNIATAAARASNVDLVIAPHVAYSLEEIARALAVAAPRGDAIAILAEGSGDAVLVADKLQEMAKVRVHPTILGHAQRAATPTGFDRRAAAEAGAAAIAQKQAGASSFISVEPSGYPVPRPLAARENG